MQQLQPADEFLRRLGWVACRVGWLDGVRELLKRATFSQFRYREGMEELTSDLTCGRVVGIS